jgi:FixJ family two-component response regulator
MPQQIRDNWPQTAVIIATGADDILSVEQSRRLGAVDFVLKPFDRELLHQALMRAMAAARSSSP